MEETRAPPLVQEAETKHLESLEQQILLKFVLCLWLISMVTVCCPPLSPDLVSQSPPVPNGDPTYVVSCCMFGSFRYFQTPLQICLLSHVTSPRIPPFGSFRVCVNLATLLYIQAVGSNWTSLSCSFPTAGV